MAYGTEAIQTWRSVIWDNSTDSADIDVRGYSWLAYYTGGTDGAGAITVDVQTSDGSFSPLLDSTGSPVTFTGATDQVVLLPDMRGAMGIIRLVLAGAVTTTGRLLVSSNG